MLWKTGRLFRKYFKQLSGSVTVPALPDWGSGEKVRISKDGSTGITNGLAAALCLVFLGYSLVLGDKPHSLDIRIAEYNMKYNISNQLSEGLRTIRDDFQQYIMEDTNE